MTATPQNKWLIFVDRERDGITLDARLNQIGVLTTLLSAVTLRTHENAKQEFEYITQYGRFASHVLIATSVMDCGVSIVDTNVKNIVIAHHNKTSFLQMLGRKRFSDNETVNLFIKFYGIKTINGIFHEYDKQLRYLTHYALLNRNEAFQVHAPTKYSDGIRERPFLSKREQQKTIKSTQKRANMSLLYSSATLQQNDQNETLGEFKFGKSAYIGLLYGISDYLGAQKDYRQTQDPLFFFKRQLMWIGQDYIEEHWIDYQETRNALIDFLSSMEGIWMYDSQKSDFAYTCLSLLENLPVPPPTLKADYCRYKDGRLPGLNKLNTAFTQKQLPYEIISSQKHIHGSRKTCWKIVKIDCEP